MTKPSLCRTQLPVFVRAAFVLAAMLFPVSAEAGSFRAVSASDSESAIVEDSDPRPQRDGFEPFLNQIIERGGFTFQVPFYWEQNDIYEDFFYAETGGKTAFLMMTADELPLSYLQFSEDCTALLEDINEGLNPSSYTVLDQHELNGIPMGAEELRGIMTVSSEDYAYTGSIYVFLNIQDLKFACVGMLVSDNTLYRYDDDFLKIVESIALVSPPAPPEESTADSAQVSSTTREGSEIPRPDVP